LRKAALSRGSPILSTEEAFWRRRKSNPPGPAVTPGNMRG
jgi:hypothetical protein